MTDTTDYVRLALNALRSDRYVTRTFGDDLRHIEDALSRATKAPPEASGADGLVWSDDLPTVTDALALELAGMTEERDHLRSLLFGNPAGPWVPIKPEGAPYWGIRTTTGETVAGTASGLSEGDAKLICNLRAFYTGTALYPHPAAVAVDAAMVERAIIAGMATRPSEYPPNWPGDYDADEQEHGRNFMRAALTAALQPAATSEGENNG